MHYLYFCICMSQIRYEAFNNTKTKCLSPVIKHIFFKSHVYMLVDKNAFEANSHEWCIFKSCWQTRSPLACLCKVDERYRSGRGSHAKVVFPACAQERWRWQALELSTECCHRSCQIQHASPAEPFPGSRTPVTSWPQNKSACRSWFRSLSWACQTGTAGRIWMKRNRLVFWFREQHLFCGKLCFVVASFWFTSD